MVWYECNTTKLTTTNQQKVNTTTNNGSKGVLKKMLFVFKDKCFKIVC